MHDSRIRSWKEIFSMIPSYFRIEILANPDCMVLLDAK